MLALRSITLCFLCLISLSAIASDMPPLLKRGMPGKNPGDIIAPLLDEQIAAWCDFKKQIVVTKTNVLCAYVGNKTSTVAMARASTKFSMRKKSRPLPKDLTPNPYEMSEYGGEA